jgi:hypothetical protein
LVNGLFKLAHTNQLKKLFSRKKYFKHFDDTKKYQEEHQLNEQFEPRRTLRQRKQPDWFRVHQ